MTAAPGDPPPARRRDLVIGPALLSGPAAVHVIREPHTGRRYDLGAREHFVLSRLDGTSTREQIGTAYAAAFGRRLGDGAWAQLLGLFSARSLLEDNRAPAPSVPAPVPAPERGLLRGEIVLGSRSSNRRPRRRSTNRQ